jgi:hypothetical protein
MQRPGENNDPSLLHDGGRHLRSVATRLWLVSLACLAAACGATNGSATTPTGVVSTASPPPSPTARVITPLEGTWSTKFTASDVSSIGWHFDPGTWLIVTSGAQSTLFRPSGIVMDETTFELAGPDEVVFPAEACPSEPQPTTGTYTFRIAGDQLVFTEVRDSCANRAFQLTAHPWTKT